MTVKSGPNGCSLTAAPPGTSRRSHTTVSSPARARYAAATSPLCPPPTTTTSACPVTASPSLSQIVSRRPSAMAGTAFIVLSRTNGARTSGPHGHRRRPAGHRHRRAGRQPQGRRRRGGRGRRRPGRARGAARTVRFRLRVRRRRRPGPRRGRRARLARGRQPYLAPVAGPGRRARTGDRGRLLRTRCRWPPVQQRRGGGRVRDQGGLPQGAPVGQGEAGLHPGRRAAPGRRARHRPGRRDDLLRPGVPRVGPAGRDRRRRPPRRPGELARRDPPGGGAARRGHQGAGRRGHQRDLRRGGRPLPGRARCVLDQRLADRRARRLPAGRARPRRPSRAADRALRSAASQGQEPGRRQRPAGRPPPRPVRTARGRAGHGGERALGGALHRERHQLLRLHRNHGPHQRLGRLVPRVGPDRPVLRAAGRGRRGGRAGADRRGRLAARRAVLALGQVRLRR